MTPEHTVIFWLGTSLLTTGLLLKLLPVKWLTTAPHAKPSESGPPANA